MRVLLLLLATSATAQSKPPTLAMDFVAGQNIHIANQRGAINGHMEVKVRVELRAGGKVHATDIGTSRKHDLFHNFTTDEDQTWTNMWSGTWKQTASSLVLDLALANRTCTHTMKTSGGAPESLPCRAVSKQIRWDCTNQQVPLRAPTSPSGIKPSRDIWQCLPAGTVDLDLTPRSWSLGKTACVKVFGSRVSLSYTSC